MPEPGKSDALKEQLQVEGTITGRIEYQEHWREEIAPYVSNFEKAARFYGGSESFLVIDRNSASEVIALMNAYANSILSAYVRAHRGPAKLPEPLKNRYATEAFDAELNILPSILRPGQVARYRSLGSEYVAANYFNCTVVKVHFSKNTITYDIDLLGTDIHQKETTERLYNVHSSKLIPL